MKSTVAIHQPMYLPWQPYFGKIISSDKFIFLDDVQYPGGTGFFNRNCIKGSQGLVTLTAPVVGRGSKPLVNDIHLDTSQPWQKKHWKSIQLNYAKAPYFSYYQDVFADIYLQKTWDSFADLSSALIIEICQLLGANTKFFRASALINKQHHGLEHLVDLINAVEGTIYLTGSGEGCQRYMNVANYAENEIGVEWFHYTQHPYPQMWGDFVPDTCMLDMLFNNGPHSLELLKTASLVKKSNED